MIATVLMAFSELVVRCHIHLAILGFELSSMEIFRHVGLGDKPTYISAYRYAYIHIHTYFICLEYTSQKQLQILPNFRGVTILQMCRFS